MEIFLLLLVLILFNLSFSIIVLPFKRKGINNLYNNYVSPNEIENFLTNYFFERDIYSEIFIGDNNNQIIETYYDLNGKEINIISPCNQCKNYYDYTQSISYIEITNSSEKLYYNQVIANETLYFQNIFYNYSSKYKNSDSFSYNKENLLKGELTFIMSKNIKNKNFLELGFQIPLNKDKSKDIPSFIEQLKKSNLIENYLWSVYFFKDSQNFKENEYEGVFVLGAEPHKYNKNEYKQEELTQVYTYVDKSLELDYLQWGISFDEVYFFREEREKSISWIMSHNVLLDFNKDFIIGPSDSFNTIYNYYFGELVKRNICFLNNIKGYYIIYCNEKIYNENYLENIPDLIFYSRNYDYNFVFNYKDLFNVFNTFGGGKIYVFNIIFESEEEGDDYEGYFNDNNKWIFGKIFLKKYQMSFDSDSKLIGFYNTDKFKKNEINNEDSDENISRKEKEQKRRKNVYLLAICGIILFIGIFALLVFLVIKILQKCGYTIIRRKKTVYEVIDDYDYNPSDDNYKSIN